MGNKVSSEVPAAKELYSRASEILGYDLLDKVWIWLYMANYNC